MTKPSTALCGSLQRSLLLQTWLSPAMPTGAFSYSHGIEAAIECQSIGNAQQLRAWLQQLLGAGSIHNEAVLFTQAWHAASASNAQALGEINELALALAGSAERLSETVQQAAALADSLTAWPTVQQRLEHLLPGSMNTAGPRRDRALPVVAAVSLETTGAALEQTLALWLQSLLGNLVWIGVRLLPLGQQQGLSIIASLQRPIEHKAMGLAAQAQTSLAGELGSVSVMADLLAIHHETQGTRLCLS